MREFWGIKEVDNNGEDGGVKEETIHFVREKVAEVKAKGGGEGRGEEHAACWVHVTPLESSPLATYMPCQSSFMSLVAKVFKSAMPLNET